MLPNVSFSIEIFFFSILLSCTVRTESVWDEMIETRDERWWHWSDGGKSSWSSSLIITDHHWSSEWLTQTFSVTCQPATMRTVSTVIHTLKAIFNESFRWFELKYCGEVVMFQVADNCAANPQQQLCSHLQLHQHWTFSLELLTINCWNLSNPTIALPMLLQFHLIRL